ncbi:MAG: PIN domain-containing protein [Deltaproteobacteria bacterium]|nr:PIN domain-containing protein [Deltaproteobacteria bacterium]MBW2116725.1 PIN domain-containing protein [Deltaproteobacteria bacterium]MBW2343933.1 PIN domain-containing protein [Deltaproteobacteria bacterium]
MSTGIIVDTCVWIEFFRRPESDLTVHLKGLLRERKVTMVGMVLAEILQGIKVQKEARLVKESLKKLPYLEMTRDIWEQAGKISAVLRKKGTTIPLSELIIASLALSSGYEVFTIDTHFEEVKGLNLYNFP